MKRALRRDLGIGGEKISDSNSRVRNDVAVEGKQSKRMSK